MSDMEETEGLPSFPRALGFRPPHRVIGTPPPSPRLLGRGDGAEAAGQAHDGRGRRGGRRRARVEKLPTEADSRSTPRTPRRSWSRASCSRSSRAAASSPPTSAWACTRSTSVFRSNLALGLSLSVALLGLGTGALIWVRHLMPDVEMAEERHEMRSDRRRAGRVPGVLRGGRGRQPVRQAAHGAALADARHVAAGRRAAGAAARHGPAARDQPAAHGVEPGPAAAGLRHQPADQPGRVQRARAKYHDRARGLHRRPGRAGQGHRHLDQVPARRAEHSHQDRRRHA